MDHHTFRSSQYNESTAGADRCLGGGTAVIPSTEPIRHEVTYLSLLSSAIGTSKSIYPWYILGKFYMCKKWEMIDCDRC